MNSGVYCIKNQVNGKLYIGSTIHFIKRQYEHWRALKKNTHHSIYLQRAWNKYGEQSFNFIILEKVTPENCITREQWYLDWYPNEYNMSKTAGSCLGMKMSEETKIKLSLINLGKKHTKVTKIKIGLAGKGRKHSQDAKNKISIARMGQGNGMFGKYADLNPAARPVIYYNSLQNLTKEFKTIKECGIFLNMKRSALSMVLNKYISTKPLRDKGISVKFKEVVI